jgi:hypothetical protein
MISRKHWSPGSDVSVQSVERRDSGGWTVSGSLTPNGICPDCGLQSRRRHGWRRRRLQDYPAHGDGVIHLPGIYVHRIVQGQHEKRIEQRTTRKREAEQAEVGTGSAAREATRKKESV